MKQIGYTRNMMYLGTSRFSYNDYVGNFYSLSLSERERPMYFTDKFDTCEVSSIFCSLPASLKATGEGRK